MKQRILDYMMNFFISEANRRLIFFILVTSVVNDVLKPMTKLVFFLKYLVFTLFAIRIQLLLFYLVMENNLKKSCNSKYAYNKTYISNNSTGKFLNHYKDQALLFIVFNFP